MDACDRSADLGDQGGDLCHGGLHVLHLGADFVGGLVGFVCEGFYLGGDDGETCALFASVGGLDRGVEGEEIGLHGDVVDDLDDAADFGDGGGELLQCGGDLRHAGDGLARGGGGVVGLAGNFGGGGAEFFAGGGDAANVLGVFGGLLLDKKDVVAVLFHLDPGVVDDTGALLISAF